jgi:hypothetical protein
MADETSTDKADKTDLDAEMFPTLTARRCRGLRHTVTRAALRKEKS